MFDTAVAQLRLGLSLGFGAVQCQVLRTCGRRHAHTLDEFGSLGSDANELLKGHFLTRRRAKQCS